MTTQLTLSHDGRTRSLDSGEILVGRMAEFPIGEGNPFVHRTIGRFIYQYAIWWVENRAEHFPLLLTSEDGSRVELPSLSTGNGPATAALTGPTFRIQFRAGGQSYVIDGTIATSVQFPSLELDGIPESTGDETVRSIRLTEDEQRLLDALAQPVLASPNAGPDALPSNRVVARQLGWTDTKLNRKLDYLCTRLTKQGYQGLKGDLGGEAKLRRWRLVEYAISHGLVGLRHGGG